MVDGDVGALLAGGPQPARRVALHAHPVRVQRQLVLAQTERLAQAGADPAGRQAAELLVRLLVVPVIAAPSTHARIQSGRQTEWRRDGLE